MILTRCLQDRLGWSIWPLKDIGFQGMVYVSRETPYMTLFKDFLAKKHRLAIDAWGADDSQVRHIYEPLIDLIKKEVRPEHQALYPAPVWKLSDRIGRLARNILVSEFLVKEVKGDEEWTKSGLEAEFRRTKSGIGGQKHRVHGEKWKGGWKMTKKRNWGRECGKNAELGRGIVEDVWRMW